MLLIKKPLKLLGPTWELFSADEAVVEEAVVEEAVEPPPGPPEPPPGPPEPLPGPPAPPTGWSW